MILPFQEIDWRISAIMCSHVLGLPAMMQGTVYPKKYAHSFVVLCFVVVMQSFIMNSHEVFIHIHQGCFVGTGAFVRLPQCQWSKPDGYGKISQYITTTKHSKAKTVCIFLGIYCISHSPLLLLLGWYPRGATSSAVRGLLPASTILTPVLLYFKRVISVTSLFWVLGSATQDAITTRAIAMGSRVFILESHGYSEGPVWGMKSHVIGWYGWYQLYVDFKHVLSEDWGFLTNCPQLNANAPY